MSFILDALKKSETDRQQHGSGEFAGVPTSNGKQGAPRWLWILGVLLAVNLAVLLGLLLRTEVSVAPAANQPVAAENGDFVEQVEEARRNVPLREEPRASVVETAPAQTSPAVPENIPPQATPAPRRSRNIAALPTIHEVLADGRVTLPALHVDIHVFAEAPKDRFVFINMNKQVEGSRLAEGPIVEEITTDGVVLNYNGTSFVLPRD